MLASFTINVELIKSWLVEHNSKYLRGIINSSLSLNFSKSGCNQNDTKKLKKRFFKCKAAVLLLIDSIIKSSVKSKMEIPVKDFLVYFFDSNTQIPSKYLTKYELDRIYDDGYTMYLYFIIGRVL